jgi:hypothetical protein
LQLGGCPGCRLLPWMTSRRLAMDREHPDRAVARFVTIDDRCPPLGAAADLGRGTCTSDGADRQYSDFFSANHTVGGGAAFSSSARTPPPAVAVAVARRLLSPISPTAGGTVSVQRALLAAASTRS